MCSTFPGPTGEPDWDLVRRRKPADIEPCIWHGPYFHKKAERIHGLLVRAYEDNDQRGTDFERLHAQPSAEARPHGTTPMIPPSIRHEPP